MASHRDVVCTAEAVDIVGIVVCDVIFGWLVGIPFRGVLHHRPFEVVLEEIQIIGVTHLMPAYRRAECEMMPCLGDLDVDIRDGKVGVVRSDGGYAKVTFADLFDSIVCFGFPVSAACYHDGSIVNVEVNSRGRQLKVHQQLCQSSIYVERKESGEIRPASIVSG